ncbi:unnamed protein product [Heligmosomoides polygyrus]|uniref:Zinc finger protein 830 n=1 Tax=Heligmosomoides polygyrus TaxID=6339 RepID=A0A183FKY5_HELPZ|nr:unnamed protein product [Heligmosomoides polygyrus]
MNHWSSIMHQCSTLKVKAKIWTAHLNGKKHRDSCERLKQQLASGPKRQSDVTSTQNGAPPVKKVKETPAPPSSDPIQTPWQKVKDDENALLRDRKGIIEGVPHGFFDDKRKDGMVRETIENEAHMNEEYDRLMRELNEKNVEEEDERDALLRDLSNADEQMEKWMRLNAMEKLKEARLQEVNFTRFQFIYRFIGVKQFPPQ